VPLASATNHVAYVVEIPKGTTAHQATDWRYYKRFNFISVPMEDYEIRDVMNRAVVPDARIEFGLRLDGIGDINDPDYCRRLRVVIRNYGTQVINRFKVILIISHIDGLLEEDVFDIRDMDKLEYVADTDTVRHEFRQPGFEGIELEITCQSNECCSHKKKSISGAR